MDNLIREFKEFIGTTEFKEDNSLMKFYHARHVPRKDWYWDTFPRMDLFDIVVKYLNWKLPIVYSKKNNPDDPFTATINAEKLKHDGGGVSIKELGGEECYEFYFDSDKYRFEAWVFLTEDGRICFTDNP